MTKFNNIVLVGFMGTGKTTVGKRLANELGWRQVDTDLLIEEREKLTIPELFTSRGEPYFRQVEKEVVRAVMDHHHQVISTGGGAALAEENRSSMLHGGFVVALTSSKETILSRVSQDENRPLLIGDMDDKVTRLLEQRRFAYDFADVKIDTTNLSVDDIVQTILAKRKEAIE
jgi:shikimate kinase